MKTRNIREVKVGDIVQDEVGDRYKVIELHKNTFACLDCDDELRPRWVYWMAFDEANEADWFIENKEVTKVFDGVDDSEEVEFTRQELKDMKRIVGVELARLVSEPDYIANSNDSLTAYVRICMNIIDKLNKMLKKKNEEERS